MVRFGVKVRIKFRVRRSVRVRVCIQDTLSSRAALGLPAAVRRASKGILHTRLGLG